jgi:hypothetical protein
LFGIVGLLAVLGWASACERPRGSAATGAGIDVTPQSVDAGKFVALRANCGDNSVPATVTSKAFGTVTVEPFLNMLKAEVKVPAQTSEGTYDVNLACPSGSTATASLRVGSKGPTAEPSMGPTAEPSMGPTAEPSMGPHTGGGFLANRGRNGLVGPVIWLVGGAAALVAAGALGAVTVRRRRHRPVR